jgi:hypothetical protein
MIMATIFVQFDCTGSNGSANNGSCSDIQVFQLCC